MTTVSSHLRRINVSPYCQLILRAELSQELRGLLFCPSDRTELVTWLCVQPSCITLTLTAPPTRVVNLDVWAVFVVPGAASWPAALQKICESDHSQSTMPFTCFRSRLGLRRWLCCGVPAMWSSYRPAVRFEFALYLLMLS